MCQQIFIKLPSNFNEDPFSSSWYTEKDNGKAEWCREGSGKLHCEMYDCISIYYGN